MADDKELGKLSQEQIKKLANTISEAKDLTSQQEEIINKVLAGETEISNARIAALEKYFDVYSTKLDLIARKYSQLDDTFLVLGQKINLEYKDLSSEISELTSKVTKASRLVDSTKNQTRKQSNNTDSSVDTIGQVTSRASKKAETLENLRESYLDQLVALEKRNLNSQLELKLARSKQEEDLWLRSTEFQLKEIEKITTADLNLQYKTNATETRLNYTSTAEGQTEVGLVRASVVEAEDELESRKQIENEISKFRNKLEIEAKAQNDGKLDYDQAINIEKLVNIEHKKRLEKLEELTKERFEQERLFADTGIKDAFEKAKIERKRQLELEAMRKNNGIITKEESIAINEILNQEFAIRSDRGKALIQELGKERLNIAELSEFNPNLVTAREAKIKKEIYDLELKYQLENEGKLDSIARENIRKQVTQKYASESEAIGELTKEYLDGLKIAQFQKDDPELAAARDAAIAKKTAELEQQYRKNNNNELTEELKKAAKKQAEEEFKLGSENMKKLAALQAFKNDDPKLAEAREAEIVKRTAELERKYRAENNNILTADLREKARRLAEEEFKIDSENISKLAAEQIFKESDPSLAAARDAEIAKKAADLELQYRLNNNNILTEDALEKIRIQAEEEYTLGSDNLKKLAAEETFKKADPKLASLREEAINKDKEKLERQARKKNGGKLDPDEAKRIEEQVKIKYELEGKEMEKLAKKRVKDEEIKAKQEQKATDDRNTSTLISKGQTVEERLNAAKELSASRGALGAVTKVLGTLAKALENTVDEIAASKGDIDTRLQGSKNQTSSGSYWDQLVKDMTSVGAITPFFKQEDFANNIKTLVDTGIAFDLKQRAFLMTIQEKIANTFDVADGTLLRLIRIQQEDSTAGRLGMEASLNAFLNNMYENTEYLKTVAAGVRSSLQEMEALMTGAEASEVEYQVQKWMGSLYSVGMSQEAVNNITTALGQVAAGQIEALTNGTGAGNLIVMAANQAGKSISEILAEGLNAAETNDLLQSVVNYLAELAEASKDSRVVQQQLANVYGVKASDLKAATNLATDNTTNDIYKTYLTYDNMLYTLNNMVSTMYKRTSLGEMMSNVWENGMYTLAGSMASNPVSYLLYKGATLLDNTVGGIDFSIPLVFGSGTAQTFNVADILRVGALGSGILGSIGPIISGLSSSFDGQAMLKKMGIDLGSNLTVTPRSHNSTRRYGSNGVGASELPGGGQQTLSSSGYVGNASASDIKNATFQETEDKQKAQMIEALAEAEATQIDYINANVLKIYEILDEVSSGKRNFTVKVAGYGLTNLGSNTSLSGAQGGVAALLSNTPANSALNNNLNNSGFSNSSSGTGYSGSNNSSTTGSSIDGGADFGASSGINLGGWTVM